MENSYRMKKSLVLLFPLLAMIWPHVLAQTPSNEQVALLTQLDKHPTGIPRAKALIDLSTFYRRKNGEAKEDLDHALRYAEQAKALSRSLK